MNNQKLYFPHLNGLRFLAASLVILTHIEQVKSIKKMNHYMSIYPLHTGPLGVTIFFVLSGFLISYLLLSEERTFKTIHIGKFYIRRILRIWPLYYLIVILALFVMPHFEFFIWPGYEYEMLHTGFFLKSLLFLLFFPNLVLSLLGLVPYASQTWSVGTEEQFYLVWPWVFKIFKRSRIWILLLLILSYHMFPYVLDSGYLNFLPYKHVLIAFHSTFNIDRMAIGGIFAVLLFEKGKIFKYVINNYILFISLLLAIVLWLNNINIPYVHFQVYSLLFGLIIANFAVNKKIPISLENKVFRYLGNISYGLYMYHPIAIVLAIAMAGVFQSVSNWLIYPFSFLFSILMAGISYRYIEKYFLRFKANYSIINSGTPLEADAESIQKGFQSSIK